ncbi:putative zinc finger DHHC domain-containing protein [Neospora caninum Liverpool]|uniref:Putative zinc finger DHHC domain-containing protein n=1 Tax=Neospora caninum (strain Liverpool) TaxID=572307 RepID=F0V932_NEOCL|nr:putative zinc finger DHHC domain-containing protein [Neospora caninum Liverpool]CBZ50257.1 putative zinc finger DHHC domain-containing protein [Neospora caninum Liverpool]|eukprot:XP_003880291.1 putative zinc finger DHHC domain-containing protein [Neospora caninum Liverpool]
MLQYHALPLLQLNVPQSMKLVSAYNRGLFELVAVGILTLLFLVSYWLAVITPPGSIPDTEEWSYAAPDVFDIEGLPSVVTQFEKMFMVLFAETLDIFLCALITGFFFFHTHLVCNGMTTIEFCEKQFMRPRMPAQESLWNKGCWRNFKDAFGSNPLMWFLPIGKYASQIPGKPIIDQEMVFILSPRTHGCFTPQFCGKFAPLSR